MRAGWGPDDVDQLVRSLAPKALAGLVRRRQDFAAAEDAVQEAMVEALRVWPEHPPRDPQAWLTRLRRDGSSMPGAASRRDDAARNDRAAPDQGPPNRVTTRCCCCSGAATPTLARVAGRADAARCRRADDPRDRRRVLRSGGHDGAADQPSKRTVRGRGFTEPGDLAVVLRVLSLVYHAGHGRRNDLAGEAIRLARQLTLATTEPEARGCWR